MEANNEVKRTINAMCNLLKTAMNNESIRNRIIESIEVQTLVSIIIVLEDDSKKNPENKKANDEKIMAAKAHINAVLRKNSLD